MKPIILASTSPRRHELLKLIQLPFEAVASNYEEEALTGVPSEVVMTLALKKAQAVAPDFPDHIIIGADTMVSLDGALLGKPNTNEAATQMLQQISGKQVRVITGIALIDTSTGTEITDAEETLVWMKQMTDEEITGYVNTGEPLDKAGAFGIQGRGAVLVERIEGDYFNVVGLPLYRLVQQLKTLGVQIF